MIPTSIAVRSSTFAFVFPTQPELGREENLRFYDHATSGGLDLPEFSQKANALVLKRQSGGTPPNAIAIRVDHFQKQLRFLVTEDFPRKTFELFKETADIAWDAFQEVWPIGKLGGRPSLAEVTLRFTAAAEGGNATDFLVDRVLKVSHGGLAKLGRKVQGAGLRLVFPVEVPVSGGDIPLSGGDGNILIETLLEDPSKVFFQMTTKWPFVAIPRGSVTEGGPQEINADMLKPSEYLDAVYRYVTDQVVNFISASG